MLKIIQNLFTKKNNKEKTVIAKKSIKLTDLVNMFSGKKVFHFLAPNDEPLWEKCLHQKQLVIIGGFDGTAIKRALAEVTKIKKFHVYEPVKNFYEGIKNINKKVQVYNEAVWTRNGLCKINVADDYSFIEHINRKINKKIKTKEIIRTVDASVVVKRLNKNKFMLFLNCEGSEYFILKQFLKLKRKPETIIFQSHETQNSLIKLLELRLLFAKNQYIPVLSCDYAWDIWVKKS